MAETMITAFSTAFGAVQTDVMAVLGAAIPVAGAIAGVTWVAKKAFKWFKSMAG